MANNTFNFKGVFDVRDVLKGIDQIKQDLGKLALGPGLESEFNRLFNNIQKQADKANAAMASGFKNKGDVTNYTNAMDQIVNSYDRIIAKLKILKADGKITLQADTSEFEKLGKELDDLNKKLKSFASDMSKASDTLDKIGQKRGKGTNNVASWENAINAFKSGDIQGTTRALNTLKGMMTKATNNGVDFDKDKTWKQFKADFDALTIAMKDYDAASKAHNQAQAEFDAKEQRTQQILADTEKEIDNIQGAMEQSAEGVKKFANESKGAAAQSQQLSSELEHFKGKAAYFFGLSNAINLFKRAVRSAYATVKDLDAVMTETAVVTNFSVGDMWSQLPEYTQRANELGVTIHDTYEAATLFYQQGLKTNEVMQISNETLKMARIAGLDAATASDRMTNALRGFNMELDKTSAQRVNDVYSKLAAITASNTDEISTAMTKVASLAHNANMEFETTAAFLAQIIESTRESAETAGTALKTVVARFSEVKQLYSKGELLGQDEEGEEIDVNKVSTALRSAGINLNEYLTGAKGLDDIFIELAEKWDSLDQVQQRYIATMAAGSRQQSRFIALMSDYKRTMQLVEAANTAEGASEEQYSKTLESLQTKLARLKNAWDEFILGLTNSEVIKKAVDLLTELLTTINKLIDKASNGKAGAKMITTFLAAFSAFKIGSGLVGKTALGGFFKSLTVNANGEAVTGARAIAETFYSNLANNMVEGAEKIKGAPKSVFSGVSNYFSPVNDNMRSIITPYIDKAGLEQFQKDEIFRQFNSGQVTVGQFNSLLKQMGVDYEITKEEAAKLGFVMKDNNTVIKSSVSEWRQFSAVAMAAGSALMVFGNMLEQSDDELVQGIGKSLKYVGGALTAFGTIMSVVLPLQAQIGAKGITAAIESIPIVGWAVLILSVLAAVGAAIYAIAKNNSAEVAAEKAAEAAKEAADAANEAREAYENLGKAWESLDEKYEAINNAVKGTQEWRDAIKEVNTAIIELMDLYDDIEVYRDEDGILHIANQEEIDKQFADAELYADANARFAKIHSLEELQYSRYEKNVSNPWNGDEPYKRAIDELQASGRLGLATDDEIREILARTFEESDTLRGLNPDSYIDAVKEYGKDYLKNQTGIEAQKTLFRNDILDRADIEEGLEGYANYFVDSLNFEKLRDDRMLIAASYETSDLQDKYAVARGYDDYKEYKDKNPDEKVTGEEMIQYVAAAEALDESAERLETFTNNIDNLTEAEKAYIMGQEGSKLTQAQLDELTSPYYDKAKLYNELGGDAVFGPEGFKDFVERFNNDLEIAAARFDTSRFTAPFVNRLNEGFGDFTKNLQLGDFETFTNNLWSVYLSSGKEGLDKIQSSMEKMTKDMEPDEIEDFIKAIDAVDWTSADSVRTLDELVEEFDISEEAVEDFKNQIIEFNNAATAIDLEKLGSALGIIKKIQSGEQGHSFTEEDYKTLTAQGVDEGDFKYNVETGYYDYIGQNLQDITTSVTDYLNTATNQLEKELTTKEVVDSIKDNYGEDIREDESALGYFLYDYREKAGDNSLIDSIPYGNFEQMQQAYDMIMEAAANANEEELNQIRERQYQLYSGTENAAGFEQGDELAGDALKQKIINSGLPQAFIDSLFEEMGSGEAMNAGNVVDAIATGKAYGIDAETLNEYVATLQEVEGLEDAQLSTLYELALANEMYQDGFKKVTDTYDDWIELRKEDGSIQPPDDGNRELLKTYSQLTKDLGEMYRVSESVTNEFLNMPDAAELLEGVIEGDAEAAAQLREELAKIQLTQMGIDADSEFGSQIFGLIDDIMAQAGELEFGATLNASPAMQALADLLQAAGYTSEQMQEIFNAFGWSPDMDTERVPVDSVIASNTTGYQEIVHPDGSKETVPIDGLTEFAEDGYITVPVIGNATFTPPEMPSYTPKTTSSGGGGGGKSEKPSYWENPYDELYNLQEKINEALRTREALERRYQKLLKQEQATLSDIRKSYYAQIGNLRMEADLQKQFAAGRLRQIQNVGEQMYTDSEGDRSSFSSLGVTKYASYNVDTGLIQIDWEGLEAIANDSSREEEGKAAEAYISKLEELVGSYEEVRDKLWDIEDEIESLREAAIESYLSFEDRVMEAVVNSYQQRIDSYQAVSDAIERANTEVLDSLREQVELSRQIRDNTEKEKDISDMENRLAYLQRDTSGGNQLEILKLQKDIEDARQSYTDSLVDQAIERMQSDADLAAEQRARQIETMQEQLEIMKDTGALWQEVYTLMSDAAAGDGALSPKSKMVELLKSTEAFQSLSNIGQAKWWEDVATEFHEAWIGLDEAEDKYKVDANNDGVIASSGTSAAINSVSAAATSVSTPAPEPAPSNPGPSDADEAGVAMNICGPNNGWGNGETRRNRLEEKGFDYWAVQSIVNDIVNSGWDDSYYRRKYGIDDLSDYSYYAFKTGGLADFTGPAWLDGTKSKPEIILNAKDSENFLALKDILASLLNTKISGGSAGNGGDNYFDIDISANIGSDYDVDKLTEKIKKDIYNDGQYRNVNTINFLR